MPASEQILKAKSPSSTIIVVFEFLSDLERTESLSGTPAVSCSVYSGTDAAPSALISGAASRSGTTVRQTIVAGTVGNIYDLVCTVGTNLSNTLVKSAKLAIVSN